MQISGLKPKKIFSTVLALFALSVGFLSPIETAGAATKVVFPTTLTTCTVNGVTTVVASGTYTCSDGATMATLWTSSAGLISANRPYLGTLRYCINNSTAVITVLSDGTASITCKSTETKVTWTRTWGIPSPPVIRNVNLTSPTSVMVAYTDSTANNGSQIVRYVITSNPDAVSVTHLGPGSPTMKINGLRPDTDYSFIVCATNAAGSACSTSSVIHTWPLAPSISLSPGMETKVYGETIDGYSISENGGHSKVYPSTYAISPSAPDGLTFSSSTGSLSGTPKGVQGLTTYTITESNISGSGSANYSLTVTKKGMSVTADAKSKTYGDTDPELTYSSSGLVMGDSLEGSLTRAAGEDVGDHAIGIGTVGVAGGKAGNYDLTFVGANLSIGSKAITVSANNASKTYGDVDPALTYTVPDGALVGTDVLSGDLSRETGEDVGGYQITGALTNSNYSVTVTPGTFTIDPKAVTASANDASKTYGDVDPALTYTVPDGALVGTDVLSGDLSREAGEDVGGYQITGALTNSNYSVTLTPGTFTINPRKITVTITGASKTYGDADPGSFGFTVTDGALLGSDVLTGSLSRVAGENVGTYEITGVLTNSNYIVTVTPGTFTIDPKAITVTADNASKTYGDVDPALTYTVPDGALVGGDVLTGSLSRESGEGVGTYEITGVLTNSNYAVTVTPGTFSIAAKAITVSANNASKTFGEVDPALTYSVPDGALLGGDVLSVSLSRVAGEDVGTYEITGVLSNSNYIVTVTPGTFTINASPVVLRQAATLAWNCSGNHSTTEAFDGNEFKFCDVTSSIPGTVTYSSGNTAIFTVSGAGSSSVGHPHAIGSATLTATITPSDSVHYFSAQILLTIHIVSGASTGPIKWNGYQAP